jgi:hypothetical protein
MYHKLDGFFGEIHQPQALAKIRKRSCLNYGLSQPVKELALFALPK